MHKRFLLLLMFFGYSLSIVHSLVPHHHHDDADKTHSHSHQRDAHSKAHHHHEDDSNEEADLSKFFSDVTHHPAGSYVVHSQNSENVVKVKTFSQPILLAPQLVSSPELKPPDCYFSYKGVDYYFKLNSSSLLRAPPSI